MSRDTSYFTLPNIITISRLLILPPVVYTVLRGNKVWMTVLISFAFFSDAVDGFIARRLNMESETGKLLDHLTDKIFLNTLLFFLALKDYIPFYFFYIIVFRDVLILIGSLLIVGKSGSIYSSDILGKIAGFSFFVTILSSIIGWKVISISWMYIAMVFAILSLIKYSIRLFRLL